jgi:pimeloyl-ACP methyl ester carboxylesterase
MDILLIPGFMLDFDLWRDVLPNLAPFGDAHHADLSQDSTLEDMARRALLSAPPVFVVAGFSMGGYVAREIIRQAPHRVIGLILIATSARGDSDVQSRRKTAVASQDESTSFRKMSGSAVASSLHPANADRPDLISRVQNMGIRLGGGVFRRQSLMSRHDGIGQLAAIRCPTLIIAGAGDTLRSAEETLELHLGILESEYAVIQGAGHMVPLEAPEQLGKLISTWIGTVLLAHSSKSACH